MLDGMIFPIARFAVLGLTLTALIPNQACASTLLGIGRTVDAFFYNGVFTDPEGELNVATGTSDPASLATGPVDYGEGAADLSTIVVGPTQIIITNLASSGAPFCVSDNPGATCPDVIDGFDFKFTGENIIGVSVDVGSAADFAPVSATFEGNTHLGLQLISPNEILVDVTGDTPLNGDDLILDVDNTPEPSSTLIFVLLGIGALLHQAHCRRARA
jgi:hypothetical protein